QRRVGLQGTPLLRMRRQQPDRMPDSADCRIQAREQIGEHQRNDLFRLQLSSVGSFVERCAETPRRQPITGAVRRNILLRVLKYMECFQSTIVLWPKGVEGTSRTFQELVALFQWEPDQIRHQRDGKDFGEVSDRVEAPPRDQIRY